MYQCKAEVIDVHDGDTFTAIVDLGYDVSVKTKFRMFGINSPELRGISMNKGIESRDELRRIILGKTILISSHQVQSKLKREKYGRWLAVVHYSDLINSTKSDKLDTINLLNVNEYMVEKGLAVNFMIE